MIRSNRKVWDIPKTPLGMGESLQDMLGGGPELLGEVAGQLWDDRETWRFSQVGAARN